MSLRVLNSVCKVIADNYEGIPVEIAEVPQYFKRPCFLVTLATDSTGLKNINVYQENPLVQIVYFGKRTQANQVVAESLYKLKEELTALFLLRLAVPILPIEGKVEKKRFAKIESYTSDLRIGEGALYVKMALNFTEDVPKTNEYELIGEVDMETGVSTVTQ
jgi:hypothetical protein